MKMRSILSLAVAATTLAGLGAADPARADRETQGYLYGTVHTESGSTYQGVLRWGREESFWDDLFNSAKVDLPWLDEFDDRRDRDRDRNRGRIRILGYRINWNDDDLASSRVFIARFGDIARIEVGRDEEAEVTMRNGEVYPIEGYSNDIGADIRVKDDSVGEIEVKWNRIETIEFAATPAGIDPGSTRLHGRVTADSGDFEGYILWDGDECQTTDILDGESEDGDLEIEMGRIRSIERRGRRSSVVQLKDGRELRLRGSNDGDSSNRGIYVEIDGVGRVRIPWDEFDRVDFTDRTDSGRAYDDYREQGPLRGVVVDRDGGEHRGLIVYDLDEAQGWEILNGDYRDMEYSIPMMNIKRLEPRSRDDCLVVLRNGVELRLGDSQDVSERNDGILVLRDEDDEDPIYLEWNEIDHIEFE